jgi:hypothetical protein
MRILALVLFLASFAVEAQQAVTVAPGGSATVTCTTCPPAAITRGQHHFAWHITTVKATNSVETCKACHGADLKGGSAVAHGDRVWMSKSNFVGPKACYANPYGATDPYGMPVEVCSGGKVAVFKATLPPTQVSCANCHDKIKAGGLEYALR